MGSVVKDLFYRIPIVAVLPSRSTDRKVWFMVLVVGSRWGRTSAATYSRTSVPTYPRGCGYLPASVRLPTRVSAATFSVYMLAPM